MFLLSGFPSVQVELKTSCDAAAVSICITVIS